MELVVSSFGVPSSFSSNSSFSSSTSSLAEEKEDLRKLEGLLLAVSNLEEARVLLVKFLGYSLAKGKKDEAAPDCSFD